MSRTYRKFPYKIPTFILDYKLDDQILRDGVSSKLSPNKAMKTAFNRLLRTRIKSQVRKQAETYTLNKKTHIWNYW